MNVLFFALIACISLAAALGVVLSRKPVHSALFLMTNFASLAILYVLLDAQFLAAAQVIIYAGGIVILILFVIMLIGHETDGPADRRRLGLAGFISLALAVVMALALGTQLTGPWTQSVAGVPSGGAPAAIGMELFTRYLLPFEFVAILLLVALIGALVMGRKLKPERPVAEDNSDG